MSRHSSVVPSLLVAALATMLIAFPAAEVKAAQNAEQIVFSGIGLPPVSSEPFGFWIWCQNTQAPPSVGQSNYETDCNGALYFYARQIVTHVVGEVTEPSEGSYVMAVASADGAIACMLSNTPPVKKGPNNTVTATCTVNGASVPGPLMTLGAVVNATGP